MIKPSILYILLATVLMAPLPAAARDVQAGELSKRLSDPGTQAAVTVALAALGEALLETKVEPVRRAMAALGDEDAADLPPDARLRDVLGPEGEELPAKIGRGVPRAMGAAAEVTGAFEEMVPQLKVMADRLRQAIPQR